MRISDWSSDVCSSDLRGRRRRRGRCSSVFPSAVPIAAKDGVFRGLVPASRSTAARPVEIILYPRMLGGKQFGDGPDRDHLLFREHGDTVAGRVKRVEIVGDEKDGKAHRIGELADQFVDTIG